MVNEKKLIIAYIPVIHRGYVEWLKNYSQAKILVLGQTISQDFRSLQKDVRALKPDQICASLKALGIGKEIEVLEKTDLKTQAGSIIMPDEEICHQLAEKYLNHCQVSFEPIWLRWDRSNVAKGEAVRPDIKSEFEDLQKQKTTLVNLDQELFTTALIEALSSSDWWRQVGAVIVKNDEIILKAHNLHLPSDQQPYIDGDPRAEFHQGEKLEISSALHAEASLIAQAAKLGVSLSGTALFVTTFPCPSCAKLIVASGIKKLIFQSGYSVLHGEEILKTAGVKICQIEKIT